MRYLRTLIALSLFLIPASWARAQVSFGVGIGGGYVEPYAYGPPVCSYGYYGYAPYACAPYGYYGPTWFSNGIFIGAGPWYHRGGYGYGYPYRGGYGFRGGYAPRAYAYGGGFRGGYSGGFHGGYGGAFRGGRR